LQNISPMSSIYGTLIPWKLFVDYRKYNVQYLASLSLFQSWTTSNLTIFRSQTISRLSSMVNHRTRADPCFLQNVINGFVNFPTSLAEKNLWIPWHSTRQVVRHFHHRWFLALNSIKLLLRTRSCSRYPYFVIVIFRYSGTLFDILIIGTMRVDEIINTRVQPVTRLNQNSFRSNQNVRGEKNQFRTRIV